MAHELVGRMPGAQMLRVDPPPGVPDCDSPLARQVSVLKGSACFAHLDPAEIDATIGSLARTVRRANYHHRRFLDLRAALDARRAAVPGEIVFDTVVDALHFELQAFCGAVRTALDEAAYLIARRHGVPARRAKSDPWTTHKLAIEKVEAACLVPEIVRLRDAADWFKMVNAYRNSAYHHGWRHGAGHFDPGDARQAARSPAMNALLLPDQESLRAKSKPHEWTWARGLTVDGVVADVYSGFTKFFSDLCCYDWATPVPAEGTMPRERHPTTLVLLVRPAVVVWGGVLVVPLFSSVERARGFSLFSADDNLEIVELPRSSLIIGQPAVSFSMQGAEEAPNAPELRMDVALDATVRPDGTVDATHVVGSKPLREILESTLERVVSIVFPTDTRVFVWRKPGTHEWDA